MSNLVRIVGFLSAAWCLGVLIALATAKPGTTGFAAPWRYWLVAAGLIFECSGIYARIQLWGTPLSYRDYVFIAINACAIVAITGALVSPPPGSPR